MADYKIIFKGEITNENNRSKIETKLAKFFKIPEDKANILFNGKAYALKKGLEVDVAIAMQQKFSAIGIVTHLVKEEVVIENITTQEPAEPKKSVDSKVKSNEDDEAVNSRLDVDDAWQKKFELALRIEQGDTGDSLLEKIKLYARNFNLGAAIFGIPYFLYKRAWTIGLLSLTCSMAVWTLSYMKFDLMGSKAIPDYLSWGILGVLSIYFGHNFNRFYYYSLHPSGNKLSKYLENIKLSLLGGITSIIVYTFVIMFTFTYDDASGVWYSERLQQEIAIDLSSEKRSIKIGPTNQYPVAFMHTAIFGGYLTVSTMAIGSDGKRTWSEWVITSEKDSSITIEAFGEVIDDIEWVRDL